MTQTSRPDAGAVPERQRDKERTRQEILDVAIREFARNGYSGARVDEIAARTRTTKRMIYYYFGGKEQLYIAALEQAYSTARDAERQLDVEHLDPVAAIRRLAELTFDHHESHPDFISMVATENIHRAEFIAKSRALSELNTPAVSVIARSRGRYVSVPDPWFGPGCAGLVRPGVSPAHRVCGCRVARRRAQRLRAARRGWRVRAELRH
jgi:AcrR family transcriptional regulator